MTEHKLKITQHKKCPKSTAQKTFKEKPREMGDRQSLV